LKNVRLIEVSDVPYALYGSDVFTLNGEKCGYLKNGKVTLFEIQKD
jgi:hypothetical protein